MQWDGSWMVVGRCDRGVVGRVLVHVVFMASFFLSAGHGWIWFHLFPFGFPLGDLGMKKHRMVGPVLVVLVGW